MESLHYMIMANQMLVQKTLMEMLKKSGLTLGQPKILDYLKDHDGSNQKEIAKACFIEPGSLTTILNKMEEKDLIVRKSLNGDRRSYHVFLTELGKEKQKLVEESFNLIEKQMTMNLSKDELDSFYSVNKKMCENLKNKGGKDGWKN